jgi:hypothetical protein
MHAGAAATPYNSNAFSIDTAFRAWAEKCLGMRLPRKLGHSCFIYFTANPDWQAHTLEKDDAIPEDHQLAEILDAIQDNKALWPQTGITFWKIVPMVLLVLLLGVLAAVLWLVPP